MDLDNQAQTLNLINSMKKSLQKVCIYSKDVSTLLGISLRHAERLMNDIKLAFGKQKKHCVTIKEFCDYKGLDNDHITRMLNE